MFHRIYESMGLGMHPASLYPRRNRIAPKGRSSRSSESSRDRIFILRASGMSVNSMYRLELLGWQRLTRRRRPRII
jgi:hypothetical protein